MWDGRQSKPGCIRDGLISQVVKRSPGHAQGAPPTPAQVHSIVDFELGLFATQVVELLRAVSPRHCTQRSWPARPRAVLHRHQRSPRHAAIDAGRLRRVIGRSQSVRVHAVPRMDDASSRASPGDRARRGDLQHAPVRHRQRARSERAAGGSGSPAHSERHVHHLPRHAERRQSLGADGVEHRRRRCLAAHADLPLYTLRRRATGETVQTTDPGRAMVTGKWNDIGKFKGPVLRALAARPPYFHDGSAATLADVIRFYDTRFQARFTSGRRRTCSRSCWHSNEARSCYVGWAIVACVLYSARENPCRFAMAARRNTFSAGRKPVNVASRTPSRPSSIVSAMQPYTCPGGAGIRESRGPRQTAVGQSLRQSAAGRAGPLTSGRTAAGTDRSHTIAPSAKTSGGEKRFRGIRRREHDIRLPKRRRSASTDARGSRACSSSRRRSADGLLLPNNTVRPNFGARISAQVCPMFPTRRRRPASPPTARVHVRREPARWPPAPAPWCNCCRS